MDDERYPQITWHTPIYKLLPDDDFVLQDEYTTKHVTLEDCLCHRTGLATHHADSGGPSLVQNVRNMRHLELTADLRTKWQYSNHMYWAVSYMIEKTTGQPLADFMREKLWRPLGMTTTFLGISDALAHADSKPSAPNDSELALAAQHMWDDETASFQTLPTWDDNGLSGAGAMVSNVEDSLAWIRAFIEQTDGPVSVKAYEDLTSAHMLVRPRSDSPPRFTGPVCYGLGWYVAVYRGERVLYHPGGLIGSVASLVILPDRALGVVGMCNVTSEAGLDAAVWHLIDEYLGVPDADRTDFVAEYVLFSHHKPGGGNGLCTEFELTVFRCSAIQGLQGMKYFATNAKDIMFPPESVNSPPHPPSLPLTEYLGSYTHPAYGTIALRECEDKALCGALPGRISLDPLRLEHIDGDIFLARADLVKLIPIRAKARFEVREDSAGRHLKLGVDLAEGLTTWFVRKDSDPDHI